MLRTILVACSLVLVTGCAELARDPRDAPWDPPAGRQLFEQIPAWDRAAERICCSALRRDDYLRARCDTDRPVPPRSNRC